MRMRTRGHQTMVTETSKTMNFWGRFVHNMLDSNPIHRYNIFLVTIFLRRVKATNEIATLSTRFTYNTTLYAPMVNMLAWICIAFAHLIIGCAIRYLKTGNLR